MSGWRNLRLRAIAGVAAVLAVAASVPLLGPSFVPSAQAQSGWWPFGGDDRPRRPEPREPMYRGPAQPGWGPPVREAPPPMAGGNICLQLEQRLVAEGQRGNQPRDVLPKIEAEMRQLDRDIRSAQLQLDRNECYETWLFSRTLKRSRVCVDLAQKSEDMRRRQSELDIQRQQIMGTSTRSMQDEIIRELARNNCGANYQQEARRRGGSNNPFGSFFWQDEESGARPQTPSNQFGALPYATYRTLCVRLCDGYYFPISFATLPNHFSRDVDACQSRCAAPTELYYHQNPGGAVEEMVSVAENKPYTSMKNAFRHRKEYVEGCSCKQAEYVPTAGEPGERKAQATEPRPAQASQRR
ncbi:MAG: DUF2865 domain-containing protein [Hyphomicrobium sp.]|nr:DUF2865 domain-containing protein [Hyphomicrobium sp.]ODT30270.1 MAG: hypothetical protein ABS54_03010 [Hyphomicrobium sp. SCN 65-11]